jgi:hypothetical protein
LCSEDRLPFNWDLEIIFWILIVICDLSFVIFYFSYVRERISLTTWDIGHSIRWIFSISGYAIRLAGLALRMADIAFRMVGTQHAVSVRTLRMTDFPFRMAG